MTLITPELRKAADEAGDVPVELADPQAGNVRPDARGGLPANLRAGRRYPRPSRARGLGGARPEGARAVGGRGALGVIRPGEIYLADTEARKRSVVIVSREE